jgi:antitoxin component YwqK of YwqJK toxin-antitoxin module
MNAPIEEYRFEKGCYRIHDDARGIYYHDTDSDTQQIVTFLKNLSSKFVQSRTNHQLHGPSLAYFEDGTLASEHWFVHGKYHGRFLEYSRGGVVVVNAGYKEGLLHGPFKRFTEDKKPLLQGVFVDGVMEGTFTVYGSDGLVVHSTTFSKGRRDGVEFAWTEEHYALFCERWEKGVRVETILPDPLVRH